MTRVRAAAHAACVLALVVGTAAPSLAQRGGGGGPGPGGSMGEDRTPRTPPAAGGGGVGILALLSITDSAAAQQAAAALATQAGLRVAAVDLLPSFDATLVLFDLPDARSPGTVGALLRRDTRVIEADVNGAFEGQAEGVVARQYAPALLGADRVRSTLRGQGVSVAVVDTGIDVAHPDLRSAVAEAYNIVDVRAQVSADAHGTAVAGIIAARGTDDGGIVGIAPAARIVAIEACIPARRGGLEAVCSAYHLARAVDRAVGSGARILNCSWGGAANAVVDRLILRALLVHGMAVVAAGGNNGPAGPPVYPAALPGVIAVGATDNRDGVYDRSNLRPYVGILAPGVDVITTLPQNRYAFVTGTSFAAAHVSGALALLVEAGRGLTAAAAPAAMLKGTAPVAGQRAGRVDVCRSLAALGKADLCR